ncbi:MAG: 16S rRNA (guanine(966)-N(2))-methyltransferase RsmD [Kiritimatiellia bacterium]
MRITGGECCGRPIKVPAGDRVRPTQDRVRSALFSMLAELVPGARVLDLFAGSGAVGLEAVSRGAAESVWVEADRRHVVIIQENVRALGATGRVVCDDSLRWLRRAEEAPFDLVFADPPYDWAQQHGFAGIADLLRTRTLLRLRGILVVEQPSELPAAELPAWECLRDRAYGHTRLVVYRLLDAGT